MNRSDFIRDVCLLRLRKLSRMSPEEDAVVSDEDLLGLVSGTVLFQIMQCQLAAQLVMFNIRHIGRRYCRGTARRRLGKGRRVV